MKAIESEFPSPMIWLAYGYSWPAPKPGQQDYKLKDDESGLLPAFIDGMIEVSSKGTIIVDGCEESYGHKTAEQFVTTRWRAVEGGLRITTVPEELFRDRMRVGFGLWVDHNRKLDSEDLEKNYFTPEEFQEAVRLALEIGDGYVWLWSERANWYADSPDWKPADNAAVLSSKSFGGGFGKYVPEAYRKAIFKGRAAAMCKDISEGD